jgi:hypothetical protein
VLQLREDHMQAFESVALDNFEERAVRHLRTRLPQDAARYSDDELRARVRRSVKRSKSYGLTSEQQIMGFVDTGLLIGENFDTDPDHPWAPYILNHREVAPEERASAVLHIAINIRREETHRHRCLPRGRRSIYFSESGQ